MNADPGEFEHVQVACDAEKEVTEKRVVLRARGLKRSFGRVCAVDALDLTVHAGEIYGFLGVNGAGKTTAIRMLMGIIKPDAGLLELMGEPTRRTTIRQKQSIGYVSQEQTFYPWMTCRSLGRFVGGLYPSWDALEFDRLLAMLDLPPDRKTSQLSGGMRMKLALALALAPRPALLVLDEPTSGLDPLARREFLDIIRRETREHGRTTFFSSHIIGEIERVADRVGIVHRGKMYFEGSLEELQASVRMVQVAVPRSAEPPPLIQPPSLPGGISAPGPDSPSTPNVTASVPEATPALTPLPEPWSPPPGLQVLRDEVHNGLRSVVLRGTPQAWEAVGAESLLVRQLSVEDIFVALVGKGAIVA
jgi:ABC-2 type transport system ATP-binding protein